MEPFVGSAAVRRDELTRRGLARDHRAVYRDVYVRREAELTARLCAHAAWLSTGAILCGLSAAAVHGAKWLDAALPAEIVRGNRRAQSGKVAHTWKLAAGEVGVVGGMDATTPVRTAFDIGRRYALWAAVPRLDALFNATGVEPGDVAAVAASHRGACGLARLRDELEVADGGAESPQESRLRVILVRGGLPRPETQIRFPDMHIRVDMGWREVEGCRRVRRRSALVGSSPEVVGHRAHRASGGERLDRRPRERGDDGATADATRTGARQAAVEGMPDLPADCECYAHDLTKFRAGPSHAWATSREAASASTQASPRR
jgi:hypothetical protein